MTPDPKLTDPLRPELRSREPETQLVETRLPENQSPEVGSPGHLAFDSALLVLALKAAHAAVLAHKDEIAGLDQAIGDGDHVFNLLRGLDAALATQPVLVAQGLGPALKLVAKTLLESVGGSAGPLLASLVLGMAKSVREPVTLLVFAGMFGQGVQAMQQRGRAEVGEKTMLDVLVPTAECLRGLAGSDLPLEQRLDRVRQAAERGMLSTRDIVATKGRAAFLGERSRGVIDPGARSCQLMIAAMCDVLQASAEVVQA